jgi:hypothetical protein
MCVHVFHLTHKSWLVLVTSDKTVNKPRDRSVKMRVACRWASLRGHNPHECVKLLLAVARQWPYFGARLFYAKVKSLLVLLIIHTNEKTFVAGLSLGHVSETVSLQVVTSGR